jgi:hypothetical protein
MLYHDPWGYGRVQGFGYGRFAAGRDIKGCGVWASKLQGYLSSCY